MTISSRLLNLLIILTTAVLLLAACGSGDDEEPLPTLAPTLDTSTQDDLPPGVEAVSTEDVTKEGPPIEGLPSGELPPGVNPEETSTSPDDGGLPFDDDEGPPGAAGTGSDTPLTTDFSTLSSGDEVRVEGTLSVLEELTTDPNEPYVILTDEQGNELRVTDLAYPVVEINRDRVTVLTGTIGEASGDDERLVLNSASVAGDDVFDPGSADSSPGDDGVDFLGEGPDVAARVETPFTLEEDLTALEAYDALVAELDGQIEGADLMAIRGNTDLGWEIRFDRPEDGITTSYFVLSNGTVQMSTAAPTGDETDTELRPIDRTEVVVDSDTAAELLVDEVDDSAPIEVRPVLVLRARRDNTIRWELDGPSTDSIDATTQPE